MNHVCQLETFLLSDMELAHCNYINVSISFWMFGRQQRHSYFVQIGIDAMQSRQQITL